MHPLVFGFGHGSIQFFPVLVQAQVAVLQFYCFLCLFCVLCFVVSRYGGVEVFHSNEDKAVTSLKVIF